ncbi:TPA: hypothetical protein I8Y04_004018 [Raoultella planticola]|nr:hypothetical protein [Raoultella planticola]
MPVSHQYQTAAYAWGTGCPAHPGQRSPAESDSCVANAIFGRPSGWLSTG